MSEAELTWWHEWKKLDIYIARMLISTAERSDGIDLMITLTWTECFYMRLIWNHCDYIVHLKTIHWTHQKLKLLRYSEKYPCQKWMLQSVKQGFQTTFTIMHNLHNFFDMLQDETKDLSVSPGSIIPRYISSRFIAKIIDWPFHCDTPTNLTPLRWPSPSQLS